MVVVAVVVVAGGGGGGGGGVKELDFDTYIYVYIRHRACATGVPRVCLFGRFFRSDFFPVGMYHCPCLILSVFNTVGSTCVIYVCNTCI